MMQNMQPNSGDVACIGLLLELKKYSTFLVNSSNAMSGQSIAIEIVLMPMMSQRPDGTNTPTSGR